MKHTKILGVIGYPISHSLSPYLHEFLAAKYLLSYHYYAFEVRSDNLPAAITGAKALGISGLNVTVPHKQRVMKHLDDIDEIATEIGAVNTIRFEYDRALGTNTDAPGFVKNLEFRKVELRGRNVFILGAGGAARAVIYAAKNAGASAIKICNRTLAHAQQLAQDFDAEVALLEQISQLSSGDVVVNSTSVGMSPNMHNSPLPEEFFRRDLVYIDLVYNPIKTRFLQLAEMIGAKTVDGLGMLIFQGAIALEHWTELEIEAEKWYDELRELLAKKMP